MAIIKLKLGKTLDSWGHTTLQFTAAVGTLPTKVAGKLRRAVRSSRFARILGSRHMESADDFGFCRLCQQEAEGKFDYDFASLVGNRKRNFLFRTNLAEISAN